MTVLQLVEQIQQHFPKVGRTQILLDLNIANKKFAHETRLLVKQADLSIVPNTVEYTLAVEFPDIDRTIIKDVLFKDSNGNLVPKTSELKFTIINGKIKFYDFYGGDISAIPTGDISTITFVYVYVPATLVNDQDEPEIEEQFHDALMFNVLGKYYSTFPTTTIIQGQPVVMVNSNLANHFRGLYKELELYGKRKANETISANATNIGDGF